jgi:DNA-binding IclR family transcriptional regulator
MLTQINDSAEITQPNPKAKPRVQSAARVISILQAVALDEGDGVTAKELAERLELPRQVIYHLIHTLTEFSMVRKVTGNRYFLGLGAGAIAEGFRRQLQASNVFGEIVRKVASCTGETSYVSGWIDGEIVVQATARGRLPIHAGEVSLGTAGAAHCRATGKLLLAMLPAHEVDYYVAAHPLKRMTPNTITTLKSLKAELEEIRTSLLGAESEEFADGLACLAVPIGHIPSRLALGLSAPVERFRSNRDEYVTQLREVAARFRAHR